MTPKSRRRVQVTRQIVANKIRDRKIGQVVRDVRPRRGAARPGDLEHVTRCGRRVEVVTGVGDPRVVRVLRVDVDRAREPSAESAVEDESSRVQVTAEAFEALALSEMKTRPVVVAAHNVPVFCGARSIAATFAAGPVGTVGGARQIRGPGRPDLDEVTAVGVVEGGRELGAVRLEIRLVAAPVLRPPDRLRALEDRARGRRVRVGDDRRVEERALGARRRSGRR